MSKKEKRPPAPPERCPKCGETDRLTVAVWCVPDGREVSGGRVVWDNDTATTCGVCGFIGKVADFEPKASPGPENEEEMEKAVALKYGLDLEGDRRRMRAWMQYRKQLRNRYHGAMLGLAAGDALGTTLEFKSPGTFRPLADMQGGGPFNLQPGQWTDDTSMALCLAESLVRCHGFDPKDQMERYCRWWQEGYLSCTGRCFDIGRTVSAALSKYKETGDPFSGSVDPRSAGNGSLMRLAPVPLAYRVNPERAIHYAERKLANHARRARRGRCVPLFCRADSRRAQGRIERGIAEPGLLSRLARARNSRVCRRFV